MSEKYRHVTFSGMLYYLLVIRFCFVCFCFYVLIIFLTNVNHENGYYGYTAADGALGFITFILALGVVISDFVSIIGLFYWKTWALCLHIIISLIYILLSISTPLFALGLLTELALFIGSLFIGNRYTKAWPQLEM